MAHGVGDPRAFDATDYRGRNVIEHNYCHLKQWRGLATRYDKHALTYRAAELLQAVITWTRQFQTCPGARQLAQPRAVD